ncbi:MAG: class I SAM-dependent methyltransferase [Phycisphaerae bacterium]
MQARLPEAEAVSDDTASKPTGQLSEEQIRPPELMRAKAGCIERDRRFLLDRWDRFVRVTCPACGSQELAPAFTKLAFSYERCADCETILMNPRPSRDLMLEFYESSANYEFWNRHIFPATEDLRRLKIFRPRAAQVKEICRREGLTGGTALEIGAGFGTFCEELERLDLFDRIIALEPTPALADTCRGKGLEIIQAPVERCGLGNACVDLIAAFEVLEHLFSPAGFLASVVRLLKPRGLLVLSCPNVWGFDVRTLGTLSNTIDHEHVNYFHPGSLRYLLRACGLAVIEVTTPGKLDADLVRKAVLEGRLDIRGRPFLKHVLIERWEQLGASFQQFLTQQRMSSHMWAVAKKLT